MGHLFLQLAVLYNVVKKLSARNILHHHKDIGWRGNDLKDDMCERRPKKVVSFGNDFRALIQVNEESSTW